MAKSEMEKTTAAINLIFEQYKKAVATNGPFNSAHEGYAVMLEELDELKAEVWKKDINRDKVNMRIEAAQIAAMALRFIIDCTDAS